MEDISALALITAAAPSLSSRFEIENFSFFGKTLEGRKETTAPLASLRLSHRRSLGEALARSTLRVPSRLSPKARMQSDGQQHSSQLSASGCKNSTGWARIRAGRRSRKLNAFGRRSATRINGSTTRRLPFRVSLILAKRFALQRV